MQLNNKYLKATLKCRPIIFTITQTGGKYLDKPIQLLPELIEIYGLSGIN